MIDEFKQYLPLFAEAANPAMQPHHWAQVGPVGRPRMHTSLYITASNLDVPTCSFMLYVCHKQTCSKCMSTGVLVPGHHAPRARGALQRG